MEVAAAAAVGEEVLVGREDLAGFGGRFFEEFDSKMAEAGGVEFFEKGGAGLGGCVEEGVAATDIGAERVIHSNAVAEMDAMFFAGAAAVGVVGAFGHESGKNAVLHVKHRHVVVDGELEPLGRGLAKEGEDLVGVEVVREGQALETLALEN